MFPTKTHAQACLPATFHKCLQFLKDETIVGDAEPVPAAAAKNKPSLEFTSPGYRSTSIRQAAF